MTTNDLLNGCTAYSLTGKTAYFRISNDDNTYGINVPMDVDGPGLVSVKFTPRSADLETDALHLSGVYVADPAITDTNTPSGYQEFVFYGEFNVYVSPSLELTV